MCQSQAAIWLLEQHADPSVTWKNCPFMILFGGGGDVATQVKNMEGYTALHWLALRSMDEDSDVEAS